VLLDWFDFATEFGERFAPDLTENLCIAPLAMKPTGAEAAFEHSALDCELTQGVFDDR